MNIYINKPTYNTVILSFLKVFYPVEEMHLSKYEQSSYRVTIGDQKVKVAYFSGGTDLAKCFSLGQQKSLLGLEGKSKIKELKMLVRGILFDLCTEVTGEVVHWGILTGIRPSKLAFTIYGATGDYDQTKDQLMTRYRLSEEKAALLIDVIRTEAPYMTLTAKEHSVYIGVPFCPSKCSYCTFTSFQADKWQDAYERYTDALIQELEAGSKWLRSCHSIYIGGGTPTSLTESDFDRLIKTVRRLIGDRKIEFTVEAGRPDSITTGKLKVMNTCGVNRISINPQTMQDCTLEKIGRKHKADEIIRCYEEAIDLGFNHINMDLILGLPGEGPEDVRDTLEKVVTMKPKSITVHTLAYKRGSTLTINSSNIAQSQAVDQGLMLVQKTMEQEGYKPYYLYRQKQMVGNFENVGYCQPGYESVYNIMIMEEATSIVAFGAGAISKKVAGPCIKRLEQPKDVNTYLEKLPQIIDRKEAFFNFPTQSKLRL